MILTEYTYQQLLKAMKMSGTPVFSVLFAKPTNMHRDVRVTIG